MLWSSSFTNLLFLLLTLSPDNFLVSAIVVIFLSVVIAGDRLPARVLLSDTCRDLFTCLGLTGEGVASSRGTWGGGTISATLPARPLPRGIGSEDGRVMLLELTRGLSGITGTKTCPTRVRIHVSLVKSSSQSQLF